MSDVANEKVLLHPDESRYYGLNEVASRVLELSKNGRSLREVCFELQKEFEVSPDQCQSEVLKLARDLVERNIVKIVEGSRS